MKKIKEVFTSRNFVYLFFGRTISNAGSIIYSIIAVLYIYNITQSGWSIGKLEVFSFLPAIILGMIGGIAADVYNRKTILIISNLILTVLFAVLSIYPTITAVYIISFLVGFIGNFTGPASSAILPHIVEKRLIVQANSVFEVALHSIRLIIPALGGFLFTWLGFTNACTINAISFLCCAVLTLQLKGDFSSTDKKQSGAFKQKFREFITIFRHERSITNILLLLSLFRLGSGAFVALIVVFLKESLNAGDSTLGIIMSVIAGGTLLGGLSAPLLENKLKQPKPIQLSLMLFAFGLLIMILFKNLLITYAMFLLIGIGNAYFSIGLNSFFQQNFDTKILGRIFGVIEAIMNLFHVISIGIGGLLSDLIGINNVYLLCAVLICVTAGLSIFTLKPLSEISHQTAPE